MRIILFSVIMASAVAVASVYVLESFQRTANQAYTTTGARISPNY